jgi:3-hydroxyisobutyrate dehydrogenase-like beta-hydroxyacid dehydrogenase
MNIPDHSADGSTRHPGKLHTIIVSSTVLPSTVIALSELAQTVGLDLIDASVVDGARPAPTTDPLCS